MPQILAVNPETTYSKFVLVFIYNDESPYFSQRTDATKQMYLLYQSSCGKRDDGETSRQAALRELYEETGISICPKRLKFVTHDPAFDCAIFKLKLISKVLERTEPEKMSSWLQYP